MRHTNASPYCAVPAVSKPAACSAASALDGWPGAQPRSMAAWKCVKSTITVTPDVAVHADAGAAPARGAGATIASIAIVAPMAATPTPRRRRFMSLSARASPRSTRSEPEHDRLVRRPDQNAIPQKQLDTDLSAQSARKAQVEAAKANLDNAKLNLGWTKIYSPIDGIAGNSNSQIGDLVGTTTKMATVSQVNPIWANFNISESQYLGNAAKISEFIRSGKPGNVPVRYIQANAEEYPHGGRIIQVNRQVASGTGTVQFTAEFPNPDAILRPGGFGRVRIQTSDNKNALLVPQAAVMEVQSLYQVIAVSPDNKATFRPVKVGERVGTNWIITEGLKPGERVVVEGLLKIQQAAAAAPQLMKEGGVPVSPKPYVAEASAAAGSN